MRIDLPAIAALATVLLPARPEAQDDFARLRDLIRPLPEESLWAEIPWMVNVREAREKAAAEGKPLLVWTMSAEPLGTS